MIHDDLTIIYYTSNFISDHFIKNTQKYLLKAVGETPIISVSFKPTVVGNNCKNICLGQEERSIYMIYKQILIGAREAKTKYVATAEDDVLYSREHFQHRPPDDHTFSYDMNKWSIFSWVNPPIFSFRPTKTMTSLITTREALVKTLEERYSKYPTFESIPPRTYRRCWAEPGRFEKYLGITSVKIKGYHSSVASIVFSTSEALAFSYLRRRKAHTKTRTDKIEPWGTAEEVLKLYQSPKNGISIIVPSRNRPHELLKSLSSLKLAKRRIEALVWLDDDDPQLANYQQLFSSKSYVRLFVGPG